MLKSTAQVYPPRNSLHSTGGYSFLEPIARLAVHRHIEPLLLVRRGDTERREERDDLKDEPRREECVEGDRGDRNDLYPELTRIPEKKPVVAGRIDDLLRKDTREYCPREAADPVRRPYVERIVDAYLMRADIDRRVGDDACDDTDGDTGDRPHEAGGGRDGYKAADGSGRGGHCGGLLVLRPRKEGPRERRRGGCGVRHDEGARGERAGSERRARVEPEPPEPQQDRAEDDERDVVGVTADVSECTATADEHRGGECRETGGHVHDRTAREVQGSEIAEPSADAPHG